jgi:hypothetical protein
LFSIRILAEVLSKGKLEAEVLRRINAPVKNHIEEEIKRCFEKNPDDIHRNIKIIEDRYQNERRPVILSF